MSVSNLARTIGITVVGYSCPDPSPADIMSAVRQRLTPLDIEQIQKVHVTKLQCYNQSQTQYQTSTTEKLIQIDSDYWSTFISGCGGEDLYSRESRILSPATPDPIFRPLDSVTPMRMSMRSGRVYEPKVKPQATTGKIFSSPVLLQFRV